MARRTTKTGYEGLTNNQLKLILQEECKKYPDMIQLVAEVCHRWSHAAAANDKLALLVAEPAHGGQK